MQQLMRNRSLFTGSTTATAFTVATTSTAFTVSEASASSSSISISSSTSTSTVITTASSVSSSANSWLLGKLFKLGSVLSKWRLEVFGLAPEIWGQVLVCLGKGLVDGLDEVLSSSGMSGGVGVAIIDTSELEELLGDGGSDNTSSTRGWNKLDSDGSALSCDLTWNGMNGTELVSPETSSDWDELELGSDESTLDGDLDFLSNLNSKTDVTVLISNDNDSLETGSLTSHSLLLDGDDLHNLVRESHLVLGE